MRTGRGDAGKCCCSADDVLDGAHVRLFTRADPHADLTAVGEVMPISRATIASGLVAAALLLASLPLLGQDAPRRLKVDLAVGFGHISGGGSPRDIPQTFDFGAVAATPLRVRTDSRLVAAASVYAHWPMDYGTSCIVRPPDTRCLPAYPKFTAYSLLAGREVGPRRRAGETRFLIGPTLMRTDEKSTVVGVQGRVDLTALQIKRLGLRVWTQGAVAPLPSSRSFVLLSGGVAIQL